MASLHLSLLPLSGRRLPNSRSRHSSIRCANERQALFSRIAPVYDNLNDLLSLGQHRIWKRMAVSWKPKREIACWICVVGVEIWRSFCLRKLGLMARWVEGDAIDLPFSDCYFDAITIGYGLRNVVDKCKAMQEVFRVLKPGSRVSVLDFNKSTQPLTALFQEWMIDNVVVPVARGYGFAEEYEYLKSSIQEFLSGEELEKLALDSGFSNAKHYEIGGGLMGNLVATR